MRFLYFLLIFNILMCSTKVFAKNLDIVVSFSVLGDIVSQVGGKYINIDTLVGSDSDPHSFEPIPKNSKDLKKSDIIFISGLGLDGWIDRLIIASGCNNKNKVVIGSRGIDFLYKIEGVHNTVTDPHAWNSIRNVVIYIRNIMNALIAADKQHASYYLQQGKAYINKLEKIDKWAKSEFKLIPSFKRKVLTSHDSLGYFSMEYGVHFLSPIGYSTDAEASASKVFELINHINSEKIINYFIENNIDPRLVKQIASASGVKFCGKLYPEALSNKDGPADTYESAFCHNVKILIKSMK